MNPSFAPPSKARRGRSFRARDHAHPKAIGVIDETGLPKKGRHTAAVHRQWCGNTGKVDNCVVGVHLAYAVGDFQCLLDSDLYLPQAWADDPQRRAEAKMPDDVVFRTKPQIALDQVRRACCGRPGHKNSENAGENGDIPAWPARPHRPVGWTTCTGIRRPSRNRSGSASISRMAKRDPWSGR